MWDESSRKGWQLAKYFVKNSGKIVHLRLRRGDPEHGFGN